MREIFKIKNPFKKQNWISYLIELVIVVLGVTIAFQLNVLQQQRKENKEKRFFTSRMLLEVESNLDNIDGVVKYRNVIVKKTAMLVKYIKGDTLLASDLLDTCVAIPGNYSIPDIRTDYMNSYLESYIGNANDEFITMLFNLKSSLESCRDLQSQAFEAKGDFSKMLLDKYDMNFNLTRTDFIRTNKFYTMVHQIQWYDAKLGRYYARIHEDLVQLILILKAELNK